MDLGDYIATLRKQWILIVGLAVIGAIGAFAYAQTVAPQYRSNTSVFVATASGNSTSELVQGSTYVQNLVQSYAILASSPIVLQPVITKLGLDMSVQELARTVTADAPINTVIIEIAAVSNDPKQAQSIAGAVAESLRSAVADISPKNTEDQPAVTLTVIAPAKLPAFAFAPDTKLLTAGGALGGLLLGIVCAFGKELLDTRLRSSREVQHLTETPVLSTVGRPRKGELATQAMMRNPNGIISEAFRGLATNLAFADVDETISSVVVTSALPGEGKSTVALGLALSMTERVPRVLLIDADLRRPSIAEYTQIEGEVGLTSVLLGDITLEEAVQSWGRANLDVLAAGTVPPNPSQLLASDSMLRLVELAKSEYDFVVIDTAPAIPVTDPLWLTHMTDGAIVVARYKRTRRQQLQRALETLESANARTVGIVLNGVKQDESSSYYRYDNHPAPGNHPAEEFERRAVPPVDTDAKAAAPAGKKPSKSVPVR